MTEYRWVFDSNCLVSRLLVPDGVAARAVDRGLSNGVLLVSAAALDELVRVLLRPKFDPYLTLEDRHGFLRRLGGVARTVNITRRFDDCRDAKDNMFLDVAVNGQADALITGDADLLVLHPFHGIPILSPAAFLDMRFEATE
jgi:putative PIN family toxin of toxin-antitoxin system